MDFIISCTVIDPLKRPSAKKMLEHPFIKKCESLDRMEVMKNLISDVDDAVVNDINDNEYKQFIFILAHFIKIKEPSFRCPIKESILLKFHLNEQTVTKHDQTIIKDAFLKADNFIKSNITNIEQTFIINEDMNNFINEINKN